MNDDVFVRTRARDLSYTRKGVQRSNPLELNIEFIVVVIFFPLLLLSTVKPSVSVLENWQRGFDSQQSIRSTWLWLLNSKLHNNPGIENRIEMITEMDDDDMIESTGWTVHHQLIKVRNTRGCRNKKPAVSIPGKILPREIIECFYRGSVQL